jgi:hypothetical protein
MAHVPPFTHFDFSAPRKTPAELSGFGVLRQIGVSDTLDEMKDLPMERVIGRAGWSLAEVFFFLSPHS